MLFYLQLQAKRYTRFLAEDMGIKPIFAFILGIIGVFWLIKMLFSNVQYAPYIWALGGISSVSALNEENRNRFLKSCFQKKEYQRIRLLENLLLMLPFVLVLCLYQHFFLGISLLPTTILLSFLPPTSIAFKSIKTPFSAYPFEFARGFRQHWTMYLVVFFLVLLSFFQQNNSFLYVALAVLLLTFVAHYTFVEPVYYVGIHASNARSFLWHKFKIAWRYALFACLPFVLFTAFFQPENVPIIIGICLWGLVLIGNAILCKYAIFPNAQHLVYQFLMTFSIVNPAALLISILVFYQKAMQNLEFLNK